ncbi:right-handed parallel beta-helix repeat-containing protein [Streptacidiphilus sp. 4-A2]|nr:right-handed parallel beta-helix repeat-containing protein [Streptacidiphilus sp. 4-A2]
MLLAAGVVVLPTATASADSTTLYVDVRNAACSDTAAGTGTAATPCTIQAAADAAQPGDTVPDRRRRHLPATTITASGSPGDPITITGGNYIYLPQLTFQGAHDITLGSLQLELSAGGITVADSSDVTLDSLRVSAPAGATAVAVSGQSSDVTLSRSYLLPLNGAAVTVGPGAQHTVITTNQIEPASYSATGIALDGATDTDVTSNTFGHSSPAAVTATDGSTGLSIENNVVYGGDIQVSADSTAQSTSGYNLFYPLPGADLYNWAGVGTPPQPASRPPPGRAHRTSSPARPVLAGTCPGPARAPPASTRPMPMPPASWPTSTAARAWTTHWFATRGRAAATTTAERPSSRTHCGTTRPPPNRRTPRSAIR